MSNRNFKNIHRLIEAATKEVPIADSFVSDYNAAVEKIESKNKRIPSQSYKPSSMKCVRNMYFQVVGQTQDPESRSPEMSGILESGSDRHERIQKVIAQMVSVGIDCEYIDVAKFVKMRGLDALEIKSKQGMETKLFHRFLNISFLCDGIIKYHGQYYILEIKTETVYKWQSRSGVADEHIDQAVTYSLCLGVDQVLFLYESRDTTAKKAYVFQVEESMKFDIISKIEESDKYVKKLVPPPLPADVSKKLCQYCNYKSACRKAGN